MYAPGGVGLQVRNPVPVTTRWAAFSLTMDAFARSVSRALRTS
jgi:hypothetical protein